MGRIVKMIFLVYAYCHWVSLQKWVNLSTKNELGTNTSTLLFQLFSLFAASCLPFISPGQYDERKIGKEMWERIKGGGC